MTPSNSKQRPRVCITLDLEEDHAGLTTQPLAYEALAHFPDVVDRFRRLDVPLTIFVSGNLLERQSKALEPYRTLEFHSHGYAHPTVRNAYQASVRKTNIEKGLRAFQDYFGKSPLGYRAPYGIFQSQDLEWLRDAGVQFDSSIFPGIHLSGFRPFLRNRPYFEHSILEVPISALFGLRVPYNMSFMRLLGSAPYRACARLNILPDPLIFDFHLHDLVPTTTAHHLSPFFKIVYGHPQFAREWSTLENWVRLLKDQGVQFTTLGALYPDKKGRAQ